MIPSRISGSGSVNTYPAETESKADHAGVSRPSVSAPSDTRFAGLPSRPDRGQAHASGTGTKDGRPPSPSSVRNADLDAGGDVLRHPSGERYKQMSLIKEGMPPIAMTGLAHANKQTFEAYDPTNRHEHLGTFQIIERTSRDAAGNILSSEKVIADAAALSMKGGSPLFTKKGVKSSKSSPTGYKLASTGQPCDKNGKVAQSSSSSTGAYAAASSSTSPARYDAARDLVPSSDQISQMAQAHWAASRSNRPYTAYADAIHATGDVRHLAKHDDLKASLYLGGPTQNRSPDAVLQHVIAGLDRTHPDQARMADFLTSERRHFLSGEHTALPAYFHCSQEDAFESIMDADQSRIKAQTPRTGTGASGAWISTRPEVSAYGPYIFALNRNMDFLHSTRSPEQGVVQPRVVGTDYHVGLQESINLEATAGRTPRDNPLSFIGVPANEVDQQKSVVARKGQQLMFTNAHGQPDVAVFSTETVLAAARAMAEVEPPKVPKSWAQ